MLHRLLRQWESPPTWLALFLALAWLQARALPLLPSGPVLRAIGALCVMAGLAVILWAAWQFRQRQTTILPRERPTALIDSGLYRFSRNPIYAADALILGGAALRWDLAALLLVPLFMAVITRRFILGEEAGLRQRFGPDYAAYCSRVRRWL